MSSLANLISQINSQISTVSESYVYYDKDTGKIHKISNKEIESDFEICKVETTLVRDIITGVKKTENFIVSYDLSQKRMTINELSYESELDSVKYRLYEIPEINNNIYDVKIIRNINDKCWTVQLSDETKKELIKSKYSSNDSIYFSITEKHNPNILYKSIESNLSSLLVNPILFPFEYKWEHDKHKNVSIYTPKFFYNYVYEVVK